MQKPLFLLLVTSLPPNSIAQPLQNLHIEKKGNVLSRWYELIMHQAVDVKEFRELFHFPT
jgi:hypothetical protein